MSLAGGLDVDGRRCRGRQARISRLADLDPAIGDELGDDEADRGAEDHHADGSLGGDQGAGFDRRPRRGDDQLAQQHFAFGEAAQGEHRQWPQAPSHALGDAAPVFLDPPHPADQHRSPSLELAGRGAVGLLRPSRQSRGRRADAPPCRCYHRASLRLLCSTLLRSRFRRAREGLFHARISALAGALFFDSSPFHEQTLTLGTPCHAPFP